MPSSDLSSKLQYTLIFYRTLSSSFIFSYHISRGKRKRFTKSTIIKVCQQKYAFKRTRSKNCPTPFFILKDYHEIEIFEILVNLHTTFSQVGRASEAQHINGLKAHVEKSHFKSGEDQERGK